MAAESSNGAGCAADGAGVAGWLGGAGISGRAYGRRRPRRGPGRFVRGREVRSGDAGASLGQRAESLPAVVGRRAGGFLGTGRIRSSSRRDLADIRLPAASIESAPTIVGTTSMGHCAAVRCRIGALGVVAVGRDARFRGIHAADEGALDYPDNARGEPRSEFEVGPPAVPRRFVPAAPGSSDGRSDCRSRSRSDYAGGIHSGVRGCGAGFDRTHGACMWPHPDRDRVRITAIQRADRPLNHIVGCEGD